MLIKKQGGKKKGTWSAYSWQHWIHRSPMQRIWRTTICVLPASDNWRPNETDVFQDNSLFTDWPQ
jgi:hypothetical protein